MIDRNMTIEEIFEKFPHRSQKLAQLLQDLGLECVGCCASSYETLESGVLGHGYNESDLGSLIAKMNEVISQPIDIQSITRTSMAAEKFKQICSASGKEGHALRFGIRPGGCSGYEYILGFSEAPGEDDLVFSSYNVEMHINSSIVDKLMGSEIDFIEGLNGSGFKISNPNAKSSCGCGSSQSY